MTITCRINLRSLVPGGKVRLKVNKGRTYVLYMRLCRIGPPLHVDQIVLWSLSQWINRVVELGWMHCVQLTMMRVCDPDNRTNESTSSNRLEFLSNNAPNYDHYCVEQPIHELIEGIPSLMDKQTNVVARRSWYIVSWSHTCTRCPYKSARYVIVSKKYQTKPQKLWQFYVKNVCIGTINIPVYTKYIPKVFIVYTQGQGYFLSILVNPTWC